MTRITNEEIIKNFEEVKEALILTLTFANKNSLEIKLIEGAIKELEKNIYLLKEKIKSDMIAYNSEKLLIKLQIDLNNCKETLDSEHEINNEDEEELEDEYFDEDLTAEDEELAVEEFKKIKDFLKRLKEE